MTTSKGILYCHATRQTPTIGPGHWFFHTGQWAACAEAGKAENGRWSVKVYFSPFGKDPPDKSATFGSIEEVQQFVSDYFGEPVTNVKPSEFPAPESL